jgi:hypothetical protein
MDGFGSRGVVLCFYSDLLYLDPQLRNLPNVRFSSSRTYPIEGQGEELVCGAWWTLTTDGWRKQLNGEQRVRFLASECS